MKFSHIHVVLLSADMTFRCHLLNEFSFTAVIWVIWSQTDSISLFTAVRIVSGINSIVLMPCHLFGFWSIVHFFSCLLLDGSDDGLFGLFTLDPTDHSGCTVETEGRVWSLDVHPSSPDLVSVGMWEGFNGVALYRLQGGQVSVVLNCFTVD